MAVSTKYFDSYSEYQEDLWIYRNLPLPKSGLYVDIGCGDPIVNSNTAFLRDLGWYGIAIDGNGVFSSQWKSTFIQAIVAPRCGSVGFHIDSENLGISRIKEGSSELKCLDIETILDRYGISKIDFLSLDIEGSEFDVIRTLDIKKHNPSIIVSEYATWSSEGPAITDFRVQRYLEGIFGYKKVHTTTANMIYARL